MFTFFSWIFFIALIAVIWWRIHLYRKNRPKGKDLEKFIGKSVLWFFATSVVCSIALIATAPDEDDSANSVKPKTHKVEKNKKKSSKSESKEKQKAEAKKEKEKEEKQKAEAEKTKWNTAIVAVLLGAGIVSTNHVQADAVSSGFN